MRNLLALLRAHGHVPNGTRSYYLNRRRVLPYTLLYPTQARVEAS